MAMTYTERFTEVHVPLLHAHANSYAAATYTSAYASLANYHRAVLVLNVGEMQAGATLDCSILQATTTAGAGSKAIAGKAITQLDQTLGDGDDLVAIELRTEELDVSNVFDCVAVQVVVAGAAVEYSYILYGIVSRFDPVPVTVWTEVVG